MDLALVTAEQVDGENPVEGDLVVSSVGDLARIEGSEEERQAITVRLRTFLGEWVLDTSQGVPYRERILGVRGVSNASVQRILTAEILSRGTVSEVVNLTMERDTVRRSARVYFEARLTAGDLISQAFGL